MNNFLEKINNQVNKNSQAVSVSCAQRVADRNKKTIKFIIVSLIICALAFTACFFAYQINSTNTYKYNFNNIAVNGSTQNGGSAEGSTNVSGSVEGETAASGVTLTIKAIWAGSNTAMNLDEAHAAASGNMKITLKTHNWLGIENYEQSFGTSVTINAEEWKSKNNVQIDCSLTNVPASGVFYCEDISEYVDGYGSRAVTKGGSYNLITSNPVTSKTAVYKLLNSMIESGKSKTIYFIYTRKIDLNTTGILPVKNFGDPYFSSFQIWNGLGTRELPSNVLLGSMCSWIITKPSTGVTTPTQTLSITGDSIISGNKLSNFLSFEITLSFQLVGKSVFDNGATTLTADQSIFKYIDENNVIRTYSNTDLVAKIGTQARAENSITEDILDTTFYCYSEAQLNELINTSYYSAYSYYSQTIKNHHIYRMEVWQYAAYDWNVVKTAKYGKIIHFNSMVGGESINLNINNSGGYSEIYWHSNSSASINLYNKFDDLYIYSSSASDKEITLRNCNNVSVSGNVGQIELRENVVLTVTGTVGEIETENINKITLSGSGKVTNQINDFGYSTYTINGLGANLKINRANLRTTDSAFVTINNESCIGMVTIDANASGIKDGEYKIVSSSYYNSFPDVNIVFDGLHTVVKSDNLVKLAINTITEISTFDELKGLVNRFADTSISKTSADIYRLMADITVSSSINIGTNSNPFTGIFDGNGYKLTFFSSATGALFQYAKDFTIQDLIIEGTLTEKDSTGQGLVYKATSGTCVFKNVYNNATVNAPNATNGSSAMVFEAIGSVRFYNCAVVKPMVNIKDDTTNNPYIGAFIAKRNSGGNAHYIYNCVAKDKGSSLLSDAEAEAEAKFKSSNAGLLIGGGTGGVGDFFSNVKVQAQIGAYGAVESVNNFVCGVDDSTYTSQIERNVCTEMYELSAAGNFMNSTQNWYPNKKEWYDGKLVVFEFSNQEGLINASQNTDLSSRIARVMGDITVTQAWAGFASIKGTFLGNGKTITFNNASQGLVNVLDGGTVQDLTIAGTITKTGSYVGGVAGINLGIINDCINLANITVTGNYVGGIAGYNANSISNCINQGTITARGNYIGGIAGASGIESHSSAWSTINECLNMGTVNLNPSTSGTYEYIGGIVGANAYFVFDSTNMVVTGKQNSGRSAYVNFALNSTIVNAGEINLNNSGADSTATVKFVGGVVGYNSGKVVNNQSYGVSVNNTININYTNQINSSYIGGFCGKTDTQINGGSSSGNINVYSGNYIGGVFGYGNATGEESGYDLSANREVECYYTGTITIQGTCQYVGGITGYGEATDCTVGVKGEQNSTITMFGASNNIGGVTGWGNATNCSAYLDISGYGTGGYWCAGITSYGNVNGCVFAGTLLTNGGRGACLVAGDNTDGSTTTNVCTVQNSVFTGEFILIDNNVYGFSYGSYRDTVSNCIFDCDVYKGTLSGTTVTKGSLVTNRPITENGSATKCFIKASETKIINASTVFGATTGTNTNCSYYKNAADSLVYNGTRFGYLVNAVGSGTDWVFDYYLNCPVPNGEGSIITELNITDTDNLNAINNMLVTNGVYYNFSGLTFNFNNLVLENFTGLGASGYAINGGTWNGNGSEIYLNNSVLFNYIQNATIDGFETYLAYETDEDGNVTQTYTTTKTLVNSATNCTVLNCTNFADVTNTAASQSTGGIVCSASGGTFINCVNYGVILTDCSSTRVGGVVGSATNCSFIGCKNYGDINVENYNAGNNAQAGGILGVCYGTLKLERCTNMGNVSTVSTTYTGGIVGNTGATGGVVEITIIYCENYGSLKTSQWITGGIAGALTNATVSNCYSNCFITIGSYHAGGLVGTATNITIANCITDGVMTSTSGPLSGILMYAQGGTVNIYNCGSFIKMSSSNYYYPHSGIAQIYVTEGKHVDVNIQNCYFFGSMHQGSRDGVIGIVNTYLSKGTYTLNITNCGYNTNTGVIESEDSYFMEVIFGPEYAILDEWTPSGYLNYLFLHHRGIDDVLNPDYIIIGTNILMWKQNYEFDLIFWEKVRISNLR